MHRETIILTKSPSTILHNELTEMTFSYSFSHTVYSRMHLTSNVINWYCRGQFQRFKTVGKVLCGLQLTKVQISHCWQLTWYIIDIFCLLCFHVVLMQSLWGVLQLSFTRVMQIEKNLHESKFSFFLLNHQHRQIAPIEEKWDLIQHNVTSVSCGGRLQLLDNVCLPFAQLA